MTFLISLYAFAKAYTFKIYSELIKTDNSFLLNHALIITLLRDAFNCTFKEKKAVAVHYDFDFLIHYTYL